MNENDSSKEFQYFNKEKISDEIIGKYFIKI